MATALIHFISGIIIGIIFLLAIWRIKESSKGEKDDSEKETPSADGSGNTNNKEKQSNAQTPSNEGNKYEGMNNVDLMKAVLKDMNCQYTETAKGQLIFTY